MEKYIKQLQNNKLFKGLGEKDLEDILFSMNKSLYKYKKGEIIANEGDDCNSLGLIISGEVEIQKIYSNGKYIVLKKFGNNNVFGEAIVFSDKNFYPATVVASTDSEILYIKKQNIVSLCMTNNVILENFMTLLSKKILILNDKITTISFKTVRGKVINYILNNVKEDTDKIYLKESKEKIAATLGIPRPSFSRELINLRDIGLIKFDRSSITILNRTLLEEELFD